MAFDYQTLKNINAQLAVTAANVIGGGGSGSIAPGNITTSVLAGSSVTGAKLANASVSLQASTITGVLPYTSGGTGLNSYPNDYNTLLRANSSNTAMEYASHGLQSMQVFTSGGTWNCPANVRYIRIQCVGGGGGGSGHGESGGAGGYSERILNVTGISSVSVSIGGDVGGSFYSGAGSNGNGVSFGPYCSANPGYGANQNNQHSGGVSGTGSGGDVNMYGSGGGSHHHSFGPGGRTYFGGSVAGGHPQGGNFSHNHQSHSVPGSGGRGAYFHGHYGSNGKSGMIIITHYY
jgi:hypothetical protein